MKIVNIISLLVSTLALVVVLTVTISDRPTPLISEYKGEIWDQCKLISEFYYNNSETVFTDCMFIRGGSFMSPDGPYYKPVLFESY